MQLSLITPDKPLTIFLTPIYGVQRPLNKEYTVPIEERISSGFQAYRKV